MGQCRCWRFNWGNLMASITEHCADCRRELGEDFRHVHEWMDAFYKTLGRKHRSVRHHSGGVEQVRKLWGDRAAQAAEIHILKDCGVVPSEQDVKMATLSWAKAVKKIKDTGRIRQEHP